MKLYALKNCDTCRKALKALDDVEFIDVREGMGREDVERFVRSAGWEKALNRKSTTWRGLSEAEKADLGDAKAVELIVQHPTLLKRPVIETDGQILIGFGPDVQAQLQ